MEGQKLSGRGMAVRSGGEGGREGGAEGVINVAKNNNTRPRRMSWENYVMMMFLFFAVGM